MPDPHLKPAQEAELHIAFACPKCGCKFSAPARSAGRRTRCVECEQEFRIPFPRSVDNLTAPCEPATDSSLTSIHDPFFSRGRSDSSAQGGGTSSSSAGDAEQVPFPPTKVVPAVILDRNEQNEQAVADVEVTLADNTLSFKFNIHEDSRQAWEATLLTIDAAAIHYEEQRDGGVLLITVADDKSPRRLETHVTLLTEGKLRVRYQRGQLHYLGLMQQKISGLLQ